MRDFQVFKLLDSVRNSYWFLPSVMALGAAVLSVVTTVVDGQLGDEWIRDLSFVYANQPEGARALLSTIAGSMITVAGVTFSITIAAVSYSASQFSPHLLTNFMGDRGNQVTLGTFTATFLYCLLVLRTIQSEGGTPPEAADPSATYGPFVPHVGVLCGLGLAIASIGVLIYFIHHVAARIDVSTVIASVGRELSRRVEERYPHEAGRGCETELADDFAARARPVVSRTNGYVQYVDLERLYETACAHDAVVNVAYRPGAFVMEGKPLALVAPRSEPVDAGTLPDALTDAVQDAFALGHARTPTQDTMFLVVELVQIAARALSPGINDPFTAIHCMDWLGGALAALARTETPSEARCDDGGVLRVVSHVITFDHAAQAVFDGLRPYASSDPIAARHLFDVMGELGSALERPEHRAELGVLARALHADCERKIEAARDREAIDTRYRALVGMLAGVEHDRRN